MNRVMGMRARLSSVLRSRFPAMVALAFVLILQVGSTLAADQPGTVRLAIARKVGYVIGDLIPYDVIVTVDPSWTLRRSSLPGAGRPEYWLDLRSVEVSESHTPTARVYQIRLIYQMFYAAIEARKRDLPGFVLTFDRNGPAASIAVPALTITVSPLREVATGTGDPEENVALEPDFPPPPVSLRGPIIAIAAAAILSIAMLVFLAWQRALGPFAKRAGVPFSRAERVLRKADPSNPDNYADGLLTLHRAFDTTAGWHVFADDLPRFLTQHARFAAARAEIANFFAASRVRFFGDDPARARSEFSADALARLAKHLAVLERGS
jgi:mxaA protein